MNRDERPPWHPAAGAAPVAGDGSAAGAAPVAGDGSAAGAAPVAGDGSAGSDALVRATRRIAEMGGWDARVPPEATWLRVLGPAPFPDADAWAAAPTYGPLDAYLRDETVTDIHLTAPGASPTIRRSGDAVDIEVSERWHAAWSRWLAAQLERRGRGRRVGAVCEGSAPAPLPGMHPAVVRYLIVEPPICPHGPSITLRVLHPRRISMRRLIGLRTLDEEMASLLTAAVRSDVDLYVVGAPGAGKTTLCQALLQTIADYRAVCLEDVAELDPGPAGVRLLTPRDDAAAFIDLVRMSLRMNPRRVVIGEVRGGEAYAALLAASNGYPVLTTVHGDHALHGVRTLAVKAAQAPEAQGRMEAIYALLNARSALVAALGRVVGRRVVTQIGEVIPQAGSDHPVVELLYDCDPDAAQWRRLAPLSAALERRLTDAGFGWEGD